MSTRIYTELREMGTTIFGRGPTNEADRLRFLALTPDERREANDLALAAYAQAGCKGRAAHYWADALTAVREAAR
jgi:hypothetical protein